MYALPHFPQRSRPERMKSDALPRRFACSPRSARIAWALAEGELVDQGLVDAVEDLVAPADLPNVGRVLMISARGMAPTCGRAGAPSSRSCCAIAECRGACARTVEHALHDRCLHGVRDEHALLAGELVAEGRASAEPASLLPATPIPALMRSTIVACSNSRRPPASAASSDGRCRRYRMARLPT